MGIIRSAVCTKKSTSCVEVTLFWTNFQMFCQFYEGIFILFCQFYEGTTTSLCQFYEGIPATFISFLSSFVIFSTISVCFSILFFLYALLYNLVTDPTPNPSPTWEGSCTAAFSAILPAPVGEGSGVGSVLLFHIFAFDYSKSLLQR